MTRALIAGGAVAAVLVLLVVLALLTGAGVGERTEGLAVRADLERAAATPPTGTLSSPSAVASAEIAPPGVLYGRITTLDGATYEGRLRFGGDEEAFWGDYFNGVKSENPWATHVPPERLPRVRRPIEILGIEIAHRERPIDLERPFMVRFGDVARIEARGLDGVRVTLKSGSVVDLDRLEAGDFDDGVRVWDGRRGVVDLPSLRIRTIELRPAPRSTTAPERLHGTVRTPRGDFTGFLQWDREESFGSDTLDGRTADGELVSVRFDAIRSIARRTPEGSLVTLRDGRRVVLSGTQEVGHGNRGIYVDDRRYGRVLVSWGAFEGVDFDIGDLRSAGNGPAYDDFPPGRPLEGTVTTRGGRRLAGRLVYDLDESETTETLDAPSGGVDYTLPFGLVASIVPAGPDERGADERGARSVGMPLLHLHQGEELQLEPAGDLGEGNAGILVFVDGRERPEYVPWAEVERIDFDRVGVDRSSAMDPPRPG